MEQNRKPRNKPTIIWSINLQQSRKECPMGKSLFNKWCGENWTAPRRRMKLDHVLTPYTKKKLKWIKDLTVRPETIKILQETTDSNVSDIGCSKTFLDMSFEAKEIKAKINYRDYIKIKICAA